MSSVDDRIVNMQFNNQQFKTGASESQKALEGLEGTLAKTAKSKGLDGLGKSVDGIKTKFSALQVAGVAALATIVAKATAAGLKLAKSLTIDPIIAGFKEYQLGLQSVQTIMANTERPIKEVNKALDQLNDFADQTIYNFGQMTKNVGTFTAAGVDLKTSVSAIKGIANLAALSGSTAEQASRAMYQLSQAIAEGKVSLQSWNSVVNAGMGGKQFQTALARTATAMGTLDKGAVTVSGEMKNLKINGEAFRTSISAKSGGETWLTSDVLVETLNLVAKGFSKAQLRAKGYSKQQAEDIQSLQRRAFEAATKIKSLPQLFGVIKESIGSTWAGVFRTVIGNFDQAKKSFSRLGFGIIGPDGFLTKAQNGIEDMFTSWQKGEGKGKDAIHGRAVAISAILSIFQTLRRVFKQVGEAFREIFPKSENSKLFAMTQAFNHFVHALEPSRDTLEKLKRIFKGVFAVLHIGFTIIGAITGVFVSLFKAIFKHSGKATGGLTELIAKVADVIVKFDKWLSEGDKLKNFLEDIGSVVGKLLNPLVKGITIIVKAFAALVGGGDVGEFSDSLEKAQVKFQEFFKGIQSALGLSDKFVTEMNRISSSIIDGLIKGLSGDTVAKIRATIENLVSNIIDWFKDKLGIHSPSEVMKDIGSNIIAGLVKGIGYGFKGLFKLLGKIPEAIGNLLGTLFKDFDALDFAMLMNAIFSGGLLLALIEFVRKSHSIRSAIIGIFDEIGGSIQKFGEAMKRESQAAAIKDIAIAVAILTVSMIALTFIDPKKLAISLGFVVSMLAELTATMFAFSKISGGSSTRLVAMASSMVIMSTAILILTGAVTALGRQNPWDVGQGLVFMGVALGIMLGAVFTFSKLAPLAEGAAGAILIMSFAMNVLAGAILMFGKMDKKTLAKGLTTMAVGLALFVGALWAFGKSAVGSEAAGLAILAMAGAMLILATAMALLGKMDWKDLAKGAVILGGGLALMVGALWLLSGLGPIAEGAAAAMLAMAGALWILATAFVLMGTVSWEDVGKGLTIVAGALSLLLLAGLAAMFIGPGLLMLGGALALVGLGMLWFGAGFALMVGAGIAGVAVFMAALEGFVALLPTIATQVGASFVAFIQVIANASPKLRKAFGTIFENFILTIQDTIPVLGELLVTMIRVAIGIIRESAGQWIEAGFFIIDKFLESAERHLPGITKHAINLIIMFMDTIASQSERIATSAANMIASFAEALAPAIRSSHVVERLRNAGLNIALAIADGVTGGLASRGWEMIKEAAQKLADALPGWMQKVLGIKSPSKRMIPIGEAIAAGVARGIADSTKTAVAEVVKMANAIIAAGSVAVADAQKIASDAQAKANKALARAQATARAAKLLKKSNPEESKKLSKRAKKQQNIAEAEQARADREAEKVAAIKTFEESDLIGKGDIKTEIALDFAEKARVALAEANAEAAEAKRLQRTNRKAAAALLKASKEDAKQAAHFAKLAKSTDAKAQAFYAQSFKERLAAIEKERLLDEENALYEKSDVAGKKAILAKRAEVAQAEADKANEAAAALMKRATEATDPREALRLLDLFEEQKALAKEALEAVKTAKETAKSLTSGGGGTSSTITPSKSVLEDAASVVDRYSKSLAQAQEFAKATEQVIQFTQNNYSPEALTASEIYRQSKNLLSAKEIKMGVTPTP